MPESDVLRSRVVAVVGEIGRAREALEVLRQIEPAFYGGVQPRFEQALTKHGDALTEVIRQVRAGTADASAWTRLRNATVELGPVMRDIHASVQSASARSLRLDAGLLRMADALLDELGVAGEFKARMTVLADREFYPGDQVAEMIRLRFPDTTIWTLPVVAHEFAHFLVRSARIDQPPGYRYPFLELLAREQDPRARSRLEELLADAFGAYAIGPAFGFTCVQLRFSPEARGEADVHPSTSVRVEAILRTYKGMTPEESGVHPYAGQMALLRRTWDALPRTPGAPVPATEAADMALLGTHLPAVHRVLAEVVPQVRYRTMRTALTLAPLLAAGSWGTRPDLDPSTADVVNAAWIARLGARGDQHAIDRIADEARRAIDRRIAARRDAGGPG